MKARERILITARHIHDEDGVDAVTMRAVASRLGLTPMALYRHFRDKEDLLEELSEAGFGVLAEYLRTPSQRSRKARSLVLIDRFLDFALEQPRLYELMFLRRRRRARSFPHDFAAHRSMTFDLLRDVVALEMAGGHLRRDDAVAVTLTIWAHAHGLISMFTLGRFGDDAAAFRTLYTRSMKRIYEGLRP